MMIYNVSDVQKSLFKNLRILHRTSLYKGMENMLTNKKIGNKIKMCGLRLSSGLVSFDFYLLLFFFPTDVHMLMKHVCNMLIYC